ncbi:hypothetical protein P692DRAFT_20924907 [Suillus brevipes Sb2]|nr:hypothetical protein P692DRAFT_20924907 [Suillus brevipes Sb2]
MVSPQFYRTPCCTPHLSSFIFHFPLILLLYCMYHCTLHGSVLGFPACFDFVVRYVLIFRISTHGFFAYCCNFFSGCSCGVVYCLSLRKSNRRSQPLDLYHGLLPSARGHSASQVKPQEMFGHRHPSYICSEP